MEERPPIEEIERLRLRIDRLDRALVDLLSERFRVASRIGSAKRTTGRSVYDPERERRVLERVLAAAADRFPPERLQAIFREIISATRSVESGHVVLVHGEVGGLAHQAAHERFGTAVEVEAVSKPEELFRRLEEGRADFAVATLEGRSFEASIDRLDLFLHSDVGISGELWVSPRIGAWTVRAERSRRPARAPIFGTPAILAQISEWLSTRAAGREVRAVPSATEAVEAARSTRGLVVGHGVLESLFPLVPSVDGIDDGRAPIRRFLLLARQETAPTGRDKTTVLLVIPNRPGTLHAVTGTLARHGVNVCWLEPKATTLGPWDHLFVLEMEGHRDDTRSAAMLEDLRGQVELLQVLGSYPDERPPRRSAR